MFGTYLDSVQIVEKLLESLSAEQNKEENILREVISRLKRAWIEDEIRYAKSIVDSETIEDRQE